mgnify:FL=1
MVVLETQRGTEQRGNARRVRELPAPRDPMTRERWKRIEGYNDYEVSTYGRVRSWRKRSETKILKVGYAPSDVLIVSLCNDEGKKTQQVRALVLRAFMRPRPEHSRIVHRDGDTTNCKLYNLEYRLEQSNRT